MLTKKYMMMVKYFTTCFVLSIIMVPLAFSQVKETQNLTVAELSAGFSDGDIVSLENGVYRRGQALNKSAIPYDNLISGVYVETVLKLIGLAQTRDQKSFVVKDKGVTQVKYNNQNGPIKQGDLVTSSSVLGEAMKATKSGLILGIALEDASDVSGLVKVRIMIQYVKQ